MESLYISFHGGTSSTAYNNIHVYDLDGNKLGKALDKKTLPGSVILDELRGFAIGPDGQLYVANAHKTDSMIVRFSREGSRWAFTDVFVAGDADRNGLDHPYDVVFGPDDNLYTSNQDNGLVTRYAGPAADQPGAPLPTLIPGLPPGTFASIPKAAGADGYPVRGIAFGPDGHLYVADETTNSVNVFDGDGHPLDPISAVGDPAIVSPVQVQFDATGALYIGSSGNDAIFTLASDELSCLIGPNGAKLDAVSGIGFDAAGKLYLGSRKKNKVLAYTLPDTEPATLLKKLRDNPEFVKVIPSG